MRFLRSRVGSDGGSMPVALLAAIVVAGIVTVLTARTIAGERAVRFDRAFTESFHTADAGVQEAVFRLNAGTYDSLAIGASTATQSATFGDDEYHWYLTREGDRSWTVTSTGTQQDVSRTVQANISEQPLFFPGAFGDTLIAVNGTSTSVDSYNSETCSTPAEDCKWGTDDDFGTGNGSIATNGYFDFSGNPVLRPGSAFLYDWLNNPAGGITASDPFGDRCDGNPCTNTYVSTIDEQLDYASDAKMAFIFNALDRADGNGDGACDGAGQELGGKDFEEGKKPKTDVPALEPYVQDSSWAVTDPTDPNFVNYYCADSLQFLDDTPIDSSATGDNPVVIFVRDFVTFDNQVTVACTDTSGVQCSQNKTSVPELRSSDTRPVAARLQIYVAADERDGGKKGSNITYSADSVFAGVVYGPRSRCGSPGGASVDIFGAVICGSMDNVGNWNFHYDDALGKYGTHVFGVGFYSEEPALEVTP